MARHKHPQTVRATVMCARCRAVYVRALDGGGLPRDATASARCLLDLGVLVPDDTDPGRLLPVPVATALGLALGRRQHQDTRRLAALVSDWPQEESPPAAGLPMTTVSGFDRINQRLDAALAASETEVLAMQPRAASHEAAAQLGAARDLEVLKRGVSMRTLYVHAARFTVGRMSYQEQIRRYPVEVRTLPGVIERMVVVDETVAFIPASEDRSQALEVRHPPLVRVLRQCFELLWRLGVPLWEPVEYGASDHEVSAVQRAIARMLVEGLDDQVVAARLGVNVRTVRGHIARLSALLGSHGRAQLGFLIARSGILEQAD
ncbi:helix-turn-helix transcriptional regulator [Streptomyces polyrhachis]|uniref:Helix-turn-helix transcriptional regulator n=1 Tax=Streptomyces polyrhachis TaxID=1282885 RepID=A0ABW2G8M5_9ACTN